jgi:hypothetical protein
MLEPAVTEPASVYVFVIGTLTVLPEEPAILKEFNTN